MRLKSFYYIIAMPALCGLPEYTGEPKYDGAKKSRPNEVAIGYRRNDSPTPIDIFVSILPFNPLHLAVEFEKFQLFSNTD